MTSYLLACTDDIIGMSLGAVLNVKSWFYCGGCSGVYNIFDFSVVPDVSASGQLNVFFLCSLSQYNFSRA